MVLNATTVGPVEKSVRDQLADYRDEHDMRGYNEALKTLLDGVDTEK